MFHHGNLKHYLMKALPPTTSNSSLTPELNYHGTKTIIKLTASRLKQSSHILTHKKVVNIYIVYKIINILVMVLDLIEDQVFHFLVVDLLKMCLLLVQI